MKRKLSPRAELKRALQRIRREARTTHARLDKSGDRVVCDSQRRYDLQQRYFNCAYRLECLLVSIESELENFKAIE